MKLSSIKARNEHKLRKMYYPTKASLNDVRQSKTSRRKHQRNVNGKEEELPQFPHVACDPNSIVIQGSSSSKEEQE